MAKGARTHPDCHLVNRLAEETSPYLRQHRENPVDWYPWGEQPFELARRLDRPVMLSVGYSACHWCHVMAHESFEDDDTAAYLNDRFVSVKVDREERPDVDAVYMEAVQAITGRGGWPMTVFLTPDRRPFYGGTYFPRSDQAGMPSFLSVLGAVHDAWTERRDEVAGQAERLSDAVRSRMDLPAGPSRTVLESASEIDELALESLQESYDDEWGGFGDPPKFPQPSLLELVTRACAERGHGPWTAMQATTLDAMAAGGIYDHLGGGFSRYSVDRYWMVPHFEKMLYDQASLARAYLHGWQVTARSDWLQVVTETLGYTLRDLADPEGGIYSAEDADSEGEEGRFYLWDAAEMKLILGPDLAGPTLEWYGATESGNLDGRNLLHRPVRGELLRPPEVEEARRLLFEARAKRVRPGLDDKVLTEWNAMFCSVLAEASAAAANPEWGRAALRIADFLIGRMRRDDGRWLRSWQAGRTHHLAYASDYAWLVDAFTRLGEMSGRRTWTEAAVDTADAMLDLFWDGRSGGLFTTAHDAEQLFVRSKDTFDGAAPSANSVGALSLARLAALTGKDRYRQSAETILSNLGGVLGTHPTAFAHALNPLSLLAATTEIVVPGTDRSDLVGMVQRAFLPDAVLAWGEPYGSPLWEARQPGWAYVCHNHTCREPVSEGATLARQLGIEQGHPPQLP